MAQDITLENGLRTVLHPQPDAHRCHIRIYYGKQKSLVGSAVETSQCQKGLAHVVEHLIFKGTDSETVVDGRTVLAWNQTEDVHTCAKQRALLLSETDISALARRHGAAYNAFTGRDKTSYFFEVPKENVLPFLEILANSAANSAFQTEHIHSEIKAVLQEMKMGNDDAGRAAYEILKQHLCSPDERGHYSTIGSETDLMKLNKSVVTQFFREFYHPWVATLLIVGNWGDLPILTHIRELFEPWERPDYALHQRVHALRRHIYSHDTVADSTVDQLYEDITQKSTNGEYARVLTKLVNAAVSDQLHHTGQDPLTACVSVPPPVTTGTTRLFFPVSEKTLFFGWRVDALWQRREARDIWETVLEDGCDARFYRRMVQTQLAHSISLCVDVHPEGSLIVVEVEPIADNDTVLAAVVKAMRDPITHEEFARAYQRRKLEYEVSLEHIGAYAMDLLEVTFEEGHANIQPPQETADVTPIQQDIVVETVQTVEICPITTAAVKDRVARRNRRRTANAQAMLDIKRRTAPLEGPIAALKYKSIPANIPNIILEHEGNLIHPTSAVRARVWQSLERRKEMYTMYGYLVDVCANAYTEYKQPLITRLKNQGIDLSYGSGERIVWGVNALPNEALEAGNCESLECPLSVFERHRGRKINALKRSLDKAVPRAMWELLNTFVRPIPFEITDVIQTLERWKWDDAVHILEAQSVAHYYCGKEPLETPIRGKQCPRDEEVLDPTVIRASHGAHRVKVIHLQRAQVVLVQARSAEYVPSEEALHTFVVVRKLLNFILFRSLGSRLFRLREETGLFYTACGSFHEGKDQSTNGMDYILLRIEPTNVRSALQQLERFTHEMNTDPNITPEELEAAQRCFEQSILNSMAQPVALISMTHRFKELFGRDTDNHIITKALSIAQSITTDELNQACKELFAKPWTLTLGVGDVKEEELR